MFWNYLKYDEPAHILKMMEKYMDLLEYALENECDVYRYRQMICLCQLRLFKNQKFVASLEEAERIYFEKKKRK